MSKFFIENKSIKVGINQIGAELANIQSLVSGKEYMWPADPAFWGRHSCILFPYIGKVWEDQYRIDGKKFEGKQHGFARNLSFAPILLESEKAVFQLIQNEKILNEYPYKFSLLMIYTLEENQLNITYEVENLDNQPIYFSLGAHPAFNVPLNENEKRADYFLEFEHPESVETLELTKGFLNGNTRNIFDGNKTIQITDDLFDKDALIFKNLNSNYLSLKNKKGEKIWTFTFENFPYLGIWSKNDKSPFICIEPWFGVADKVNADWDFREKEGVIQLLEKEKFKCQHSVIIH